MQLRLSIRDSFDAPDCALQKNLGKLNAEVGYDFDVSLAWVDIHRDLGSLFPDLAVLVPSVTGAISAYLQRLLVLLEADNFQEAFLEKMKGKTSIIVRIGEGKTEDTSSFDMQGRLMLSLPIAAADWYRTMLGRVGHDLERLFLNPDAVSEHTADWVDIPASKGRTISESMTAGVPSALPAMSTLSKPETLFPTLLPYFVIITTSGANLHIESAHQPTLTLLHTYFSTHVRKDLNLTTQVHLPISSVLCFSPMD